MFENGHVWIHHDGCVPSIGVSMQNVTKYGSNWRLCNDFWYITNLFSLKSCMASHNLWPNKGINYAPKPIRHACGATVPWTSLLEEHLMITKDFSRKKAHNFTSNENSLFTTAGDWLPSVVVSGYICFYLSHWWIIQWCSGCQDGGDLVLCTNCNIIAICSLCIYFGIGDGFECPPCFKKKKPVPYVCFWFNFLLINICVDLAIEISILWCW